jgi:hemin uptake protein HemP
VENGAQVMTTAANENVPDTTDATTPKVRILVSDLLQGGREAILVHDGSDYRLRITANGKLILTK